jgi:uncharacterized protein
MKLSDGEKLIVALLCDIHKKLKIADGLDPVFIEDALSYGHGWAIRHRYDGIFTEQEISDDLKNETRDILEMWWFLESSGKRLSTIEKMELATKTGLKDATTFHGFDGNNETDHKVAAQFFIQDLEMFEIFADRDLNSHVPTLDRYRSMLLKFGPIRSSMASEGRGLDLMTVDEIVSIFKK